MTDLSKTIQAKSDQLNAADLIGNPMVVKITKVSETGDIEQPIAFNFEGDNGKPFKPCKTLRRFLMGTWGKDGKEYVGRMLLLYYEPTVMLKGKAVGGIRFSHMTHIDSEVTMTLPNGRGKTITMTVKPLVEQPIGQVSETEFAAVLEKGDEVAAAGLDTYKAWFTTLDQSMMSAEQKDKMRECHAQWKSIALNVKKQDDEECPV